MASQLWRVLTVTCIAMLVVAAPAAASHFGRWTFDRLGLPAFADGRPVLGWRHGREVSLELGPRAGARAHWAVRW